MKNNIIDFAFFEENEQIKRFYKAKESGKVMGMAVEMNGEKFKVFTPELFTLLTCKYLPIGNEIFDGFTLIKDYVRGFDNGIKYFNDAFAVKSDTLYNNPEPYINNLHLCFFHKAPNANNHGWNYWINNYPASVNTKTIEEYGFYAGVICSLDSLKEKHPIPFKDFDKCSENLDSKKTATNSITDSKVDKFEFTKDALRVKVIELANLNGYEKPSTYLDSLLEKVQQLNDFDFECNFFLNIHYLCKENASLFWSEGHRNDILIWFKKAPIITEVFATTWEILPESSQHERRKSIDKENRTTKIILNEIEDIDKNKGWGYAFLSEIDLNTFANLLTSYFEYKPYTLPKKSIVLKRDCKTRLAKALRPIHKELSNENKKLKNDIEFFKIIRVLSHFKNMSDIEIYNSITR